MKLVFLDRSSIGYDISIDLFRKYGDMTVYDFTSPEEVHGRICEADIVITNKAFMDRSTLESTSVRLICVTATGTDNVDLEY